ncbi:hypothetical protein EHS25_009689 [Saitozyma podzolica]|uniref:Uncharacterized protein n=1 Tax=Saitozyma podzolica TaxID=1890683 RepID=A0A427YJZ1_9TREE|nr:hypothetical protein EHS25_009689 [Saitozyma podzolica]
MGDHVTDEDGQLEQLVDRLRFEDEPGPLTRQLQTRASDLRNEQQRIRAGETALPNLLVQVLSICRQHLGDDAVDPTPWLSLAEQAGRTAANLVAENDPNRDRLVRAGYVEAVSSMLSNTPDRSMPLGMSRALAASLLNLVVQGHEPSLAALATDGNVLPLLRYARRITPLLLSKDSDDWRLVAGWFWNIIALTCQTGKVHGSAEIVSLLLDPLCILPVGRLDAEDVPVVTSACEAIEATASVEGSNLSVFMLAQQNESAEESKTPLDRVTDFIESAAVAPGEAVGDDGDDGDESGDDEVAKTLGAAKRSLVGATVELSCVVPNEGPFWETMRRWLSLSDRDDLQTTALLCFGNRAMGDGQAEALLPTLMDTILGLLEPTTPMLKQHAVVGLLKNLSIPTTNKAALGQAGVIAKLASMSVWSPERDLVGSVQGGSVGVVKNLCRDNVDNAVRLLEAKDAVGQILDLITRTEDPAIRFEATRVFVNALRSLANTRGAKQDAIHSLSTQPIVNALCNMLAQSRQYPLLTNEAVISLALLATFGPPDTCSKICTGLVNSQGLKVLGEIVAPASEGAFSREVQANSVTLLRALRAGAANGGETTGRVRKEVSDAVRQAKGEGRAVAEGAEAVWEDANAVEV